MGADWDRLEGSQREGGISNRSGGARNEGVDGLGVRADDDTTDGNVRGTGEEESLGASGSSGAEWSGAKE